MVLAVASSLHLPFLLAFIVEATDLLTRTVVPGVGAQEWTEEKAESAWTPGCQAAGKWECGVSSENLHIEQVPNQVLLYSVRSCVQQP